MVYREAYASPLKVTIHEKVWQTWQYLISLSAKTEEEDQPLRVLQELLSFETGAVSVLPRVPSVFMISPNALLWCFLCMCLKTSGIAMTPSAHGVGKKIQKTCVEPVSVIGDARTWFQSYWEVLQTAAFSHRIILAAFWGALFACSHYCRRSCQLWSSTWKKNPQKCYKQLQI